MTMTFRKDCWIQATLYWAKYSKILSSFLTFHQFTLMLIGLRYLQFKRA